MTELNQLTQTGSTNAASQPLSFKVVSQSADYPAPTVREVTGGTLKPFDARNGATVAVTYPTMNSSHKIIVRVTGHNEAANFLSEEHAGSDTRTITVKVPAHVIGANQGHMPLVRYEVILPGQAPKESGLLELNVGTLEISRLPTPEVPEAEDGVLDLSSFEGNASIKVLNAVAGYVWPLWGAQQRYWVWLEGTTASSGEYKYPLAQAAELTEAEGKTGLSLELPRNQLEGLKDGSELKVILKVSYDHDRVEDKAREFPILRLTLQSKLDFIEPSVPEAVNRNISTPDKGATIKIPAAAALMRGDKVRGSLNGSFTAEQNVESPGVDVSITVPPEQVWLLDKKGSMPWLYEVYRNGKWHPSKSINIVVNDPKASGTSDWETLPQGTFTSATTSKGITVSRVAGTIASYRGGSRVQIAVSAHSEVKIVWPSTFTHVQFWVYNYLNKGVDYVAFYDTNNRELEKIYLPGPSFGPYTVRYDAPEGNRIKFIQAKWGSLVSNPTVGSGLIHTATWS